MECSLVSNNLYEYIYGELDERSADDIRMHLDKCSKCHNEYLELKKLLIDDMQSLISLKESIEVPEDLSFKIRSSTKPKLGVNIIKYTAAACILFSLIFTTPVLAYYIIQSTPLSKYLDLDKNIVVNFEEGRGQLVQKSSTMNGITLTVDGIIRKKDKATILFTVKVPESKDINYGMPLTGLNELTITDQFGIKYRVGGGSLTVKSVNEDGEAKCIFDMEPIKFWAYKLNVRVTALELGYYDGKNTPQEVKNTYGNWNVSFYIDRSITGGDFK